jgi:hypothetical protein
VKAARFQTSTASGLLGLFTVLATTIFAATAFAAATNLSQAGMSTLGIVVIFMTGLTPI